LFSTPYTQTLEPRIYYLYVPYQNQNTIPVFDGMIQTFTYDQMFRINRFTSVDRIGDANQVSLGVSSRLLDDNGIQKLKGSIGLIRYFQNRLVTLCSTPDCIAVENPNYQQAISPVAGVLQYNLNAAWSITGNAAWNPTIRKTDNSTLTFTYNRDPRHLFSIGYNYVRDGSGYGLAPGATGAALRQLVGGVSWPILTKVNGLAGWNDTLSNGNTNNAQSFFYGLQYETCCWAIRTTIARTYLGPNANGIGNNYDKQIYVQWILKGFGSIGNGNATNLLSGSIPGFQDEFNNSKVTS
jgi:LPS-assembly protein